MKDEQWFWEQCGFRSQKLEELTPPYRHKANLRWVSPLNEVGGLPSIHDLNALFKYAVPKVDYVHIESTRPRPEDLNYIEYQVWVGNWNRFRTSGRNKEAGIALYEALFTACKERE